MTAKTVRQRVPMRPPNHIKDTVWPNLPFDAWQDTCETLHMWTQIVGKVRLMKLITAPK